MFDVYAIIATLLFWDNPIQEAKELTRHKSYQESIKVLEKTTPGRGYVDYCFYMSVNYYSLNNKKEAERWITLLEHSFEPIPKRYETVSLLMRTEMKYWKNDDDD